MVDAFVRVWIPRNSPITFIRLGAAIMTVSRWSQEPWESLTIIECQDSYPWNWEQFGKVQKIPAANFTRESILFMELESTTEIFAGTDDDMLIYGPDFLKNGLEIMKHRTEYGMIVASPTNELGWCPHTKHDDEVVTSWAIGGPGFTRKGIWTDFPDIDNSAYAGHLDKQCRDKGLKQGYFRDIKYLHLGSRYSHASPRHCDGVENVSHKP